MFVLTLVDLSKNSLIQKILSRVSCTKISFQKRLPHNFITMATSTSSSRPKPTRDIYSSARKIYAEFHTPPPPAAAKLSLQEEDEDEASSKQSFDMFRNVMKTGVLYATSRAQKHGFKRLDDPEWANSYVDFSFVVLCFSIY